MERSERPVVLGYAYRCSLLRGMVQAKRPGGRFAIFWQIAWPNPEAFAIWPWQL